MVLVHLDMSAENKAFILRILLFVAVFSAFYSVWLMEKTTKSVCNDRFLHSLSNSIQRKREVYIRNLRHNTFIALHCNLVFCCSFCTYNFYFAFSSDTMHFAASIQTGLACSSSKMLLFNAFCKITCKVLLIFS